ncbi:MAG: hypothetical protein KAR12_02065 [Methylococcales bacterium]|nr:hypothetical protein [Methylococcales bacterium]
MTSSFSSEKPVESNNKLPFSINKSAFSNWMGGLDIKNEIETLQSLLSTLHRLNNNVMQPELRLFFHQKLSSLAEQLSEQLQATYKNSHFPFSKQDKLKVDLSACCSAEIAKGYVLLCEDKDFKTAGTFSQQLKALIIHSGIQAQANLLLYKSMIYEKPGKEFWHLCFLFYLYAKKNAILDHEINTKNTCFINTFKLILIFELSNTQQYNTEEMLSVFNLLSKFSGQLDLSSKIPEKKFRGVPCINLRGEAPPFLPKEETQQEQPYLLYLSSLKVIKQLVALVKNKEALNQYNKSTLLRLIKTLTMNRQRKSERELADDELYALIGFDEIKKFLLGKEKAASKMTKLAPGELRDLDFDVQLGSEEHKEIEEYRSEREANLTIATHFIGIEGVKGSDIWADRGIKPKPKPKQEKKEEVEEIEIDSNVELVDKSSSGFSLCFKDQEAMIKVGDIIGLMIAEILVITVIRRIIQAQEHMIMVGVEVLGKDVELLRIFNLESHGSVLALYLKSLEDSESIIIEGNDFQNENYLFADYNDGTIRFRVEKQLHASSMLRHVKVAVA